MRPLARTFLQLRDQGYHIRSLTLPALHHSRSPAPMIGDRLAMINQTKIDVFFDEKLDKDNNLRPPKTRDVTQKRGNVLGALQVNTPFEFAFKRADGSLYNSVIIPQKSCDIAVFVSPSEQINGYSNGVDTITITTALAEAIEQDLTLSLILAHEMAHIIMVQRALPIDENLELKADQIALLLLHNAGLDGAKAVQHWQGFNHPHADLQENSATHYGIKTRMGNFQNTLTHISAHIKPQTEPEQKLDLSALP